MSYTLPEVLQGRHNGVKVSSLRDFGAGLLRLIRWLKPPVNKVLSLRDIDTERSRSQKNLMRLPCLNFPVSLTNVSVPATFPV